MLYFNRGALILCTKLLHLQHCMKNINFQFLAVLSILLISFSCEYSPSEIPLTEVEEPSETAPFISIDLTPEMDTIKLSTSVYVSYKVDVGSLKIYDVKFLMDGTDMGTLFSDAKGLYATTLSSSQISDGLHELKVRTYTSTNSGSIADKVQAEGYLYEFAWPVVVNKGAKDQMKFTNLQVVPNGIKLSWLKYDYADFQRYTVNKISTMPGQSKELANTTNPYQNSVIDLNYVEGDYVTYSLYTYMDGFVMDSKSYVEEIRKPNVTINADRTVDVNWSQSKYPQNVKSYYLKTTIPTFGYPEDKEIVDLNQTTTRFNEKLGFGGNYGMQLRYIPKGYDGYNTFDVKGGLTQFALGDSISAFQRGFLITGKNSILIYNNGKFSKYNYATHQSSGSLFITPIESVYQRYITGSASGKLFGYFESQQFVVRNSEDLSLVKRLNVEAYDGFNFRVRSISLSDEGTIATIDNSNTLRIFNANSGQRILEKIYEAPFFLQDGVLSPDGKNICLKLGNYTEGTSTIALYRIEANELVSVGGFVKSGSDYESTFTFSPVDGKLIYFNYLGGYNYKVDVINPQTLVVENTVQIPEWFIPIAYDYANNRVIAQYQFFPIKRFSYMLDVKTGLQSKIVQFVGQDQVLFSDGKVFSGNGRSIKIDDYIIQ